MDGIEVMKGNEFKGGGSGQGTQWGGGGVFHKALGSACVSLESKAFTAYHTSHKARVEDIGILVNVKHVQT